MVEAISGTALPTLGAVIGEKYELRRVIGRGGMGSVYEALNTWTERRVAVKVLESRADGDEAKRFLLEARAATRIDHPNIVEVLDMGQDPATGALYLVAELLSGSDLRDVLTARERLPPREALGVVVPIIEALAAAHALGIIHRDVKPENILLSRSRSGAIVPKLIDFGIAKFADSAVGPKRLTHTGATLGTPHYLSPERARGVHDVEAHADVWAIAVVLYEIIAGHSPFDGDSYNAILYEILVNAAPSLATAAPNASPDLVRAVDRALEKNLAKRTRSMSELIESLRACPEFGAQLDWSVETFPPPRERSATPRGAEWSKTGPLGNATNDDRPTSSLRTVVDLESAGAVGHRRRRLVIAVTALALVAFVSVGALLWSRKHHTSNEYTRIRPVSETFIAPRSMAEATPNRVDTPSTAPVIRTTPETRASASHEPTSSTLRSRSTSRRAGHLRHTIAPSADSSSSSHSTTQTTSRGANGAPIVGQD